MNHSERTPFQKYWSRILMFGGLIVTSSILFFDIGSTSLTGRVLEEKGPFFSRGSKDYTLKIETSEGVYHLGILDSYRVPHSPQTLTVLSEALEVGDKIKFSKSRNFFDYCSGKICTFRSNEITLFK